MKPTILLINFQDQQKLRKLKMALLPFKIRLKTVETQDYSQPIGYLAGVKESFSGTDSISADPSGADGEGNADSCRNHGESV